jgi:hypothetical protein
MLQASVFASPAEFRSQSIELQVSCALEGRNAQNTVGSGIRSQRFIPGPLSTNPNQDAQNPDLAFSGHDLTWKVRISISWDKNVAG